MKNNKNTHHSIYGVIYAYGINLAAVHVHAYVVAGQLHCLVFQVAFAVQIGRTVRHHYHRIACLIMNWRLDIAIRPHCHRAE